MNNWILKVKNWQIFLIFLIEYITGKYLLAIPEFAEGIFIILLISYVGWYVLLGNILHWHLPRNTTYSITWLVADAFLVILFYTATIFIFNCNLEINGLLAIPGFYLFFAIAHLYWFPAAALVSIENQKEATFSQYAGTAIQLLFWPIGIWFAQPRLNKLNQSMQQTHKE